MMPILESFLASVRDPTTTEAVSRVVCNVNFPCVSRAAVKGTVVARQGTSVFVDRYSEIETTPEERQQHPTRRMFRLDGHMPVTESGDDIDTPAMQNGFVVITPLGLRSDDAADAANARAVYGSWPCVARV